MEKPIPAALTTVRETIDMLPGLGRLEQELKQLNKQKEQVYLICYDIEALRRINYAYGREAGDALLNSITDWVNERFEGALYRVDGDMFCVLLRHTRIEEVMRLAQEAYERSKKGWTLQLHGKQVELCVTASIAVIQPSPSLWDHYLLDVLERTLEISKRGKRVAVYGEELDREICEFLRMQLELKNSLLLDMAGFSLQFQPIVNPHNGIWKGLEALCRWNSKEFGSVSPLVFIREVERMGLMSKLGQWVLETAVSTCAGMGLVNIPGFFLSVNVSSSQIVQHDCADRILAALDHYGYPPHQLNLEITESAEFEFTDDARKVMDQLRSSGVSLALDDFGTGYSTLNNLKKIPATFIKTEREFIANIENDRFMQYYLYLISESAHLNSMYLIAEGVETDEQLQTVIRSGADYVQGYYFSKPIAAKELYASRHKFHARKKKAQLEDAECVSFNQWISTQESFVLSPAFFGLINQCIRIVLDGDCLDCVFEDVLNTIGRHFNVRRAFVFLRDEGFKFSNRYEWCADEAYSRKDALQRVDFAQLGIYDSLLSEEFLISNMFAGLSQPKRKDDAAEKDQTLLIAPITRKGILVGCVGFEDNADRKWRSEEVLILHNICLLVLIALSKWGEYPSDV